MLKDGDELYFSKREQHDYQPKLLCHMAMDSLYYLENLLFCNDRFYMEKVWISPGCISCGSCQFIAPEVFEVTTMSTVKDDADLVKNTALIEAAARACPVQVIKFTKDKDVI